MSPIYSLQKQWRELGRIRMGHQVTTKSGKRAPSKLETFRLTSPSRDLIDRAASVYGGQVKAWEGQWEVVTKTDSLDIIVPPGQSISQWYELWKGGGCARRCDGITEVLTDQPCLCAEQYPDIPGRIDAAKVGGACKATTRLNVMLPKLPDIGVWRLESHGYYAAVEMSGTAELLMIATAQGRVLPARLRLDQRQVKRIGQVTKQFAVPVLEVATTAESFLGTGVPTESVTIGAPRPLRVLQAGDPPMPTFAPTAPVATPAPESHGAEPPMPTFAPEPSTGLCGAVPPPGPMGMEQPCEKERAHVGAHKSAEGTWPA